MRYLLLALTLTLAACGGRVVVDHNGCAPASWQAFEGAPVAATGAALPFDGQAVVARVGPFPDGAQLDRVTIGVAPGWGCALPERVGAWSGGGAPVGDPRAHLRPAHVEPAGDLGGGFALVTVVLPEPVDVEPGEHAWIGLDLSLPQACGASAQGPAGGQAWRWTEAGGWREEAGRLVVSVDGCRPASAPGVHAPE